MDEPVRLKVNVEALRRAFPPPEPNDELVQRLRELGVAGTVALAKVGEVIGRLRR